MSEESVLRYEVDGHVGVITLNRPEAMNSLTYESYMRLEDAVRGSTARALVITGEGRAFCAGDDVKQILGSTEPAPAEFAERAQHSGAVGVARGGITTGAVLRGFVAALRIDGLQRGVELCVAGAGGPGAAAGAGRAGGEHGRCLVRDR